MNPHVLTSDSGLGNPAGCLQIQGTSLPPGIPPQQLGNAAELQPGLQNQSVLAGLVKRESHPQVLQSASGLTAGNPAVSGCLQFQGTSLKTGMPHSQLTSSALGPLENATGLQNQSVGAGLVTRASPPQVLQSGPGLTAGNPAGSQQAQGTSLAQGMPHSQLTSSALGLSLENGTGIQSTSGLQNQSVGAEPSAYHHFQVFPSSSGISANSAIAGGQHFYVSASSASQCAPQNQCQMAIFSIFNFKLFNYLLLFLKPK